MTIIPKFRARRLPIPFWLEARRTAQPMTMLPDSALADLQRAYAALQAQLDENHAERDAALAREAALAEVLDVINRSPGDPGPVFEAILEKAHRLCGADLGAMTTYDGVDLRTVVSRGYSEAAAALVRGPVSPSPAQQTLIAGERYRHIPDVRAIEFGADQGIAGGIVEITGLRTFLMVPLRKDGTVRGFLTAHRLEVRPFLEQEIALLESFAAQAVIAMENARLIAEQREALEQQTATAEVLQVINASPGNLTPVFDAMLEKAMRLCEAQFGVFSTYDGERFRRVAAHGMPVAETQAWPEGVAPDPGSALERVVNGDRVVHILDLVDTDAHRQGVASRLSFVETTGARTALWVALRKDDAPLGVFVIYRREVRAFSEKQIALVQNFADQAVIAIENTRLLTEQREALEQQTATADVMQVINASPGELGPVFDTMLDRAMRLCKAAFGELHTFDGDHFKSAAFLGVPAGYAEVRMRTPRASAPGSIGRRFLEGASILHITDLMAEENYLSGNPDRRALVDIGGARTVLAVALRKDDALLGNILIYRQEVRPFTDRQIALLQNFAAQAVIAMENARLFDELRERTAALAERNSEYGERIEQQSATIDVLKVMSASPDDTQPVFDLIARRAQELCNVLAAGLFEFDGELVHLRSVSGSIDSTMLAVYAAAFPMAPTRASITCRAILDGRIVHIRDMDAEPGLLRVVRDLGVKSNLAVPLLRGGAVIGAIALNTNEPGGFSDSQVALVQTFAEQAVIAIGSVANFRKLQERTAELTRSVAELQALEEVLRAVNSSLDLGTVLQSVIDHAVRLSGADEGTIYEFDAAEQVFVPRHATGMSKDWLAQLRDRRIRIGETPLGRSAAARAPLHIADLGEEPEDESKRELDG